eukprot:TRINITY_DN7428_c0_g1_i2.p1 TRINITY_DN7428_c0_g1~~TRINITY_DN7428_c0_g1_i2.p1  ORF type:complete len:1285 (-),score=279.30 TRINITY_DN7428_c0_g1_i2:19-3414(-)
MNASQTGSKKHYEKGKHDGLGLSDSKAFASHHSRIHSRHSRSESEDNHRSQSDSHEDDSHEDDSHEDDSHEDDSSGDDADVGMHNTRYHRKRHLQHSSNRRRWHSSQDQHVRQSRSKSAHAYSHASHDHERSESDEQQQSMGESRSGSDDEPISSSKKKEISLISQKIDAKLEESPTESQVVNIILDDYQSQQPSAAIATPRVLRPRKPQMQPTSEQNQKDHAVVHQRKRRESLLDTVHREDKEKEDEKNTSLDSTLSKEQSVHYVLRPRKSINYSLDNLSRKRTDNGDERFDGQIVDRRGRKPAHIKARKNTRTIRLHSDSDSDSDPETSSDSSDDSDHHKGSSRQSRKSSRYSIKPIHEYAKDSTAENIELDPTIGFDCVGGLEDHINSLKEMIIMPLMYPELFQQFGLNPPRGVLFVGPPGTGKTLMARALANACSVGSQKVSFFMRKGADILSKWLGETEKHLRLLFEEARRRQPSIIFFDEIDGLAPVRSGKQDQIHSSVVSTLLALMDGLDSRGNVVLIGATNRVDAIDPALRRPGRFDREFFFPPPSPAARRNIVKIHTRKWTPPPSEQLLDHIVKKTNGFSGADIQALCTEAAMVSVRKHFPQIYRSTEKLVLDHRRLVIAEPEFDQALHAIKASSSRTSVTHGLPLPCHLNDLLGDTLQQFKQNIRHIFPFQNLGKNSSKQSSLQSLTNHGECFRPVVILHGKEGMGQSQLLASLLEDYDHVHVQCIDIFSLYLFQFSKTLDESLVHLFNEANRHSPTILFLHRIEQWIEHISTISESLFLNFFSDISGESSVMLIATCEDANYSIPEKFQRLQKHYFRIPQPSTGKLESFSKALMDEIYSMEIPSKDVEGPIVSAMELPAVSSSTMRIPSIAESKQKKEKDQQSLREMRVHLRQVLENVSSNSRFRWFNNSEQMYEEEFLKSGSPISFQYMRQKIDTRAYLSSSQLLDDFQLMIDQLNDWGKGDKQRHLHRAHGALDVAASLCYKIDSALVAECEEIMKRHASSSPLGIPTTNTQDNPQQVACPLEKMDEAVKAIPLQPVTKDSTDMPVAKRKVYKDQAGEHLEESRSNLLRLIREHLNSLSVEYMLRFRSHVLTFVKNGRYESLDGLLQALTEFVESYPC